MASAPKSSPQAKLSAKSLFSQLEAPTEGATSALLAEVQEEISKKQADKVKQLVLAASQKYDLQVQALRRLRQQTAQHEAAIKKSMDVITELTQSALDLDQEVIDSFSTRLAAAVVESVTPGRIAEARTDYGIPSNHVRPCSQTGCPGRRG